MAKGKMMLSMFIFGTLGLFVTHIALPSAVIALSRAVLGSIFLIITVLITRKRINWTLVRNNWMLLLLSGVALGFNWMFLFEAYHYTTVAVATLCYYMAPVFVVLLSPIVLKEKMTIKKIVCSGVAVLGAVMISGVNGNGNVHGIAFSLAAAMCYCSIVIMNKKIKDLPPIETTLLQLAISAIIMLPYVAITEDLSSLHFNVKTGILLLVIGIIHTGICYLFYFSSIKEMPAQTAAVFSYIDPVTAILLSAFILRQPMTKLQIVGTVLILGSTLMNEVFGSKPKRKVAKLEVGDECHD